MAVSEEVLLSLQVDNQQALANIAALTAANEGYKKSLDELKAIEKAGNQLTDEQIQKRNVLQQQIKENTAGIRENAKEIKTEAAAVASASDSINGMRARVADLTRVYNSLSATAREGSAGKEIQKEILEMNNSINSSNKAVGNFKDNIGQYEAAVGKLPGVFGQMQASGQSVLVSLRTKFDSVKDATMSVRDAMMQQREAVAAAMVAAEKAAIAEEALAIAEKTGAETSALAAEAELARGAATTTATAATEASSLAMKIFKYALLSTGIGALVVALGAVVTYFTKTNDGAKNFAKIMAGVNAVMQVGVKVMGALGKLLFSVMTGDLKGVAAGWKDLTTNIKGATVELKANYEAGVKNMAESQAMKKREREWSGERLKLLKDYEEARFNAGKKSRLDDEGKIAAAKKAMQINEQIYKQDLDIAKKKAEMVENEQKLLAKKDMQAIQDAKNRVQEVINAHAMQQLTVDALLGKAEGREAEANAVSIKGAKAKAKELKEEQEKSAKARQEVEDRAENIRLAKLKEDADNALKILDYSIKMESLKIREANAGKILTNEEYHKQQLQKIQDNAVDEAKELNIKLQNEQITEKEFEDAKALIRQNVRTQTAEENAAFEQAETQRKKENAVLNAENELAILDETSARAVEIKKAQLDAQMAEEIKAAEKSGASQVLITKKYEAAKKKIDKEALKNKLETIGSIASSLKTAFGETTKLGKAAGTAEVAINTFKSAFETGAIAAKFFAAGNIPQGIAATAQTVAIGVSGAKAIKDIWSVSEDGTTSGSSSTASASTTASTGIASNYSPSATQAEQTQQILTSQPASYVRVTEITEVQNLVKVKENSKI